MTKPMKFEIRDPQWAKETQEGLEEYMTNLYKASEAEKGSAEAEKAKETESGIPFCACNVCEGREILAYIAPRVVRGYLDRKVGFVEVDDDWGGRIIEVPTNLKHD
jgi:hypothetical protein